MDGSLPVFEAKTSSARQILSLLKCIGFLPKAHIQISGDGVRFSVEDSRVMQGHVFVDKKLFNEYAFKASRSPAPDMTVDGDDDADTGSDNGYEDTDTTISFGISLSALLECLQIFGAEASSREKWGQPGFSSTIAPKDSTPENEQTKLRGTCTMIYQGEGYPLKVVLEENEIITTCELTTYESEASDEIPLDSLSQKIIMKADWLYDAIQELDGSSPDRLTMAASPRHPFFSLNSVGPMGSTSVEFSNDRSLLETFQVPRPVQNTYKFGLIKHAARAMAIASKVSIRGDILGVLSLQFMIGPDGKPNFVDFRYLPFENENSDGDDQ